MVDVDDLPRNDMMEEYDSIEIIGQRGENCVFDLIMQMSSKRLYSKMVKRCIVEKEQQKALLDAIQNIWINKGRQYSKVVADIMDQCTIISDITESNEQVF